MNLEDEWKNAVEDAMIIWEMLPHEGESAKSALNRLIAFEQEVALDPNVSMRAQELIDLGQRIMQEKAYEACMKRAQDDRYHTYDLRHAVMEEAKSCAEKIMEIKITGNEKK